MSGLVVRRRAERDIDEQLVYFAKRNHQVATRFLEAIEQTFQMLVESPDRGFLWDDVRNLERGIHVWPVRRFTNYLVFYRVADQTVDVVRVLHGARDIASLLENEW